MITIKGICDRRNSMESKKLTNMDADKEYILSGTINEIISALTSDFSLPEEEARFVAYVLTKEKKDKIVFAEHDLNLWYMNEENNNTAPIFNLPYTISITKLELEMEHNLFIFIGMLVFTKEYGIAALGLELIWSLKQAIQKIDKDDYCIYGRIVDFLQITHKGSFEIKDIIPYDKDHECNRRPENWICHYWNHDRCSLGEDYISIRLKELEKRGVLTNVNGYWQMAK